LAIMARRARHHIIWERIKYAILKLLTHTYIPKLTFVVKFSHMK